MRKFYCLVKNDSGCFFTLPWEYFPASVEALVGSFSLVFFGKKLILFFSFEAIDYDLIMIEI